MFARVIGSAVLCLCLAALGLPAAGQGAKDAPKEKTVKDKKDDKEANGVAGKVKSVNADKPAFTIVVSDTDKERTFTVTDETKFIGPMGGKRGTGKEGLADEAMAKGAEVRVIPDSVNGRSAVEVHLAKRKSDTKDDKK